MRIGLDGIPLTLPKTGVGHYTFELACAIARLRHLDDFELLAPYPFQSQLTGTANEVFPSNLHFTEAKVNVFTKHWWMIGLPAYLRRIQPALFHGTNYDVPLWNRCPTVLTIHDLSSLLHPQTHEVRRVRRARRRLPLMANQATMIITPSESVRDEVRERLRISADKIVAVPEAPRRAFRPLPLQQTLATRKRLGVEDEFLLFVGTIEPRKNLLTLMRAFAQVAQASPTGRCPQLVIAGAKGWLTDELFAYTTGASFSDRLLFTGYVSDSDLCALYSSCRLFIYPSLYEGFGLPPLEAMRCGAAVITSRVPSLIETVGDAAHCISPMDVNALARSILELLADDHQRNGLAAAGQQRAKQFSWERTAELTLSVYQEALRRWHA